MALSADTNVSEKHTVFIFRVKEYNEASVLFGNSIDKVIRRYTTQKINIDNTKADQIYEILLIRVLVMVIQF